MRRDILIVDALRAANWCAEWLTPQILRGAVRRQSRLHRFRRASLDGEAPEPDINENDFRRWI